MPSLLHRHQRYERRLALCLRRPVRYRWLQPEDGPRRAEATRLAVELALQYPDWRVSVQTHKILGVD